MNSLPLNDFDNVTAVGILARAAISLADEHNPAADFIIPNEPHLRRQLILNIGKSLGVDLDALSEMDKVRIEEELDKESERLMDPVDESNVLKNLSAKGYLPTDLYEISIDAETLFVSPRKKDDEMKLVRFAIHAADRVQHLLNDDNPIENPPISLFAKYFENRFANRSFTMLVTGFRVGLQIKVRQAWRIYSEVPPSPSAALFDLLRKFAEEYGIPVEVNGQRGNFFANIDVSVEEIRHQLKENFSGDRYCFVKLDRRERKTRKSLASLLYAVDLDRYSRRLAAHKAEDEKMTDWAYPIGLWRSPANLRGKKSKERSVAHGHDSSYAVP